MHHERELLDLKIEKLTAFTSDRRGPFVELAEMDRLLLQAQLSLMQAYSKIITLRIDRAERPVEEAVQ